jgi:hypothetical protein
MQQLKTRHIFSGQLFIAAVALLLSCNSATTKKHAPLNTLLPDSTTCLVLNKNDSTVITACLSSIVKTDTIISATGCSKVFRCYDDSNRLRIRKEVQYCISDSRLTWSYETYYNNQSRTVLKISRDGLSKILKAERDN